MFRYKMYYRDRTTECDELVHAKFTRMCLATLSKNPTMVPSVPPYVIVGSAGSLSIISCSAGSLSFGLFLIRI